MKNQELTPDQEFYLDQIKEFQKIIFKKMNKADSEYENNEQPTYTDGEYDMLDNLCNSLDHIATDWRRMKPQVSWSIADLVGRWHFPAKFQKW